MPDDDPIYTAKYHDRSSGLAIAVYVWSIDGDEMTAVISATIDGERETVWSQRLSSFCRYSS